MYVVTYGVAARFSIENVRQPASTFEEKSRRLPSFAFSRGVPFSPGRQSHRQKRRRMTKGQWRRWHRQLVKRLAVALVVSVAATPVAFGRIATSEGA
jgi:hypothetical protein